MTNDTSHLSWDEWDELQSPRPDVTDFDGIVDNAMSRRGFLGRAVAFGSGAAVMGTGLLNSSAAVAQTTSRIGFTPSQEAGQRCIILWRIVARMRAPHQAHIAGDLGSDDR